jgi:cytoskeletal protein RodZ
MADEREREPSGNTGILVIVVIFVVMAVLGFVLWSKQRGPEDNPDNRQAPVSAPNPTLAPKPEPETQTPASPPAPLPTEPPTSTAPAPADKAQPAGEPPPQEQ